MSSEVNGIALEFWSSSRLLALYLCDGISKLVPNRLQLFMLFDQSLLAFWGLCSPGCLTSTPTFSIAPFATLYLHPCSNACKLIDRFTEHGSTVLSLRNNKHWCWLAVSKEENGAKTLQIQTISVCDLTSWWKPYSMQPYSMQADRRIYWSHLHQLSLKMNRHGCMLTVSRASLLQDDAGADILQV